MLHLQGLDAAQCLDDLRAAHAAYLHAVRRLRLSDPERDWHVVASAITAVLNAVLQFCALVRSSRREREVRRACPHCSFVTHAVMSGSFDTNTCHVSQ